MNKTESELYNKAISILAETYREQQQIYRDHQNAMPYTKGRLEAMHRATTNMAVGQVNLIAEMFDMHAEKVIADAMGSVRTYEL